MEYAEARNKLLALLSLGEDIKGNLEVMKGAVVKSTPFQDSFTNIKDLLHNYYTNLSELVHFLEQEQHNPNNEEYKKIRDLTGTAIGVYESLNQQFRDVVIKKLPDAPVLPDAPNNPIIFPKSR